MTSVKTIKDVEESSWHEFKGIAARNKLKMGALFGKMVEDYKEENAAVWNKILNPGKILSDEEAGDMEKTVAKLRKERGFR